MATIPRAAAEPILSRYCMLLGLAAACKQILSAFSSREIDVLVDWVGGGGALLLIVDYMPLAGMSAKLAPCFSLGVS